MDLESELYNSGIVDVSHRYPKMYVVQPQFFVPLITLLRNAIGAWPLSSQQFAPGQRQGRLPDDQEAHPRQPHDGGPV